MTVSDTVASPATPAQAQRGGGDRDHLAGPSRIELTLAAVALALLAALLLGGHVLHGGLYTDDWPIRTIDQLGGGTGELIHQLFIGDHSRPLAALYLGLTQSFAGGDVHAHAAVALGLHALECWTLFWLLRELRLTRWQAGGIALLALLFPYSDSTWLWFAISQSSLSMCLATLGLIATVRATRVAGRRAAGLHAAGIVLCMASVLTYETTAAIVVLAVPAILYRRVSSRAAAWRSVATIAGVALAAGVPRLPGLLPGIEPHVGLTTSQELHHAGTMASQAVTVLSVSAMPFGAAHRNVVIPILGLIVLLAIVAWRRSPDGSPTARELTRWLGWAAAGAVVLAAAYVVFINTNLGYQPAGQGENNRINAAAVVGYCLIIYALAMLAATLLTRRPRSPVTVALASLVTVLVAIGFANRSRSDVHSWDRAASLQRTEISRLARLPRPAAGTTLYTFGGIGEAGAGVYVFEVTWDLDTAVELHWHDPTLHAYPIFSGTTFTCGPASLYPSGPYGDGPAQAASYGKAAFYDFRNGRTRPINSRADCLSAESQFVPAGAG